MSLERIEITPLAVIVGELLQEKKTGNLTILRPPLRKTMYWSQGELVLIVSAAPEDALGETLVRRGIVSADRAVQLLSAEPTDTVSRFHETGVLDLSSRQTILREWTASQFLPLFSLDEGTAAFTEEEEPLDPEKRVFLQSTPALVMEGIRSITNGLVLRRSLGDLKREIAPSRDSRFEIDSAPLTEAERRIAAALNGPTTIESFLKHFAHESVAAAKVVIGMLALGLFEIVDYATRGAPEANFDDMQRDLELLAAIGSSDPRSLRAIALSKQLPSMDHYQLLDLPRAVTRGQIVTAAEQLRKAYDPDSFPPIVRETIMTIHRRIDEALMTLKDTTRRAEYDKLLSQAGRRGSDEASIQQRQAQRSIAEQNFERAKELIANSDYYSAIVLLKQCVQFTPDRADAWFLLGSCQERNPKWHRQASESFQKALSIDPEFVDALISLGDLYRAEGLTSRAQTCWEDALKIAPDNQQAKSRLGGLKKR